MKRDGFAEEEVYENNCLYSVIYGDQNTYFDFTWQLNTYNFQSGVAEKLKDVPKSDIQFSYAVQKLLL